MTIGEIKITYTNSRSKIFQHYSNILKVSILIYYINKNLTALKSNSNTVWFNFQTVLELDFRAYIRLKIKPNSVRIRF
jgi:hypothetical protein